MRSEFQDVFKDAYDHWIDDACSHRYNASKSLALQVWQHQQSKVDGLQRRNQMLSENIKEQGQKLVNQNEVIETQAEKLLGLRDEKAELQKRVDASLIAFEKLKEEINQLHGQCDLHLIKYLEEKSQVLEQELKGDQ